MNTNEKDNIPVYITVKNMTAADTTSYIRNVISELKKEYSGNYTLCFEITVET